MQLFTPTGVVIVSTLERLYATSGISSVSRDEHGCLDIDYDGETEMDWDSQTTVTRGGYKVFIDENGQEWTEDKLTLRDEMEGEGDEGCPYSDPDCLSRSDECHDTCKRNI